MCTKCHYRLFGPLPFTLVVLGIRHALHAKAQDLPGIGACPGGQHAPDISPMPSISRLELIHMSLLFSGLSASICLGCILLYVRYLTCISYGLPPILQLPQRARVRCGSAQDRALSTCAHSALFSPCTRHHKEYEILQPFKHTDY